MWFVASLFNRIHRLLIWLDEDLFLVFVLATKAFSSADSTLITNPNSSDVFLSLSLKHLDFGDVNDLLNIVVVVVLIYDVGRFFF